MHFKKVKTLKALKKCLKKTLPEKVSQVRRLQISGDSCGNIIEAGQMDGG